MTGRMMGAIEGFYGLPWTWDERREVCRGIAAAGGNTYVYAPKDDPLHRDRWRTPYPDEDVAEFASLVAEGTVRVGFAISPGLSIDPASATDRTALSDKIRQLTDAGVDLVVLALDDLPFSDGLGRAHGELTAWLRSSIAPWVELAMVPSHYAGVVDVPYLADLRATVPEEVAISWTGPFVVNDRIEVLSVEAWREVMDGRAPLLWDNFPVNDLVMSDRLFLGPLRGREPGVAAQLAGYLANGGLQATASIPPIRSAIAWAAGRDPLEEWEGAIGAARALGRCIDEHALSSLLVRLRSSDGGIDVDVLDEVDAFLDEATTCTDGGLGPGVAAWIDATHTEASVGRMAVQVLRHTGTAPTRASMSALALGVAWPPIRRHVTSVFGPRQGFRPVLGLSAEGDWLCDPAAFDVDQNAIDALVRLALAAI